MRKWYQVSKPIILMMCVSGSTLFSQTKTDNDLLFQKNLNVPVYENRRQVSYLFKGRNAFVKYNPVSMLFGGLLFAYQKTISIQIGAACPYEVNCSNFSKICIQKFGIIKGIPLTADRLTRCTRMAGLDMIKGVDYNARTHKIYDSPDDYKFGSR